MCNATSLFYGHTPESVSMEIAVRNDGEYFVRYYEFNGFQNAWSKWLVSRMIQKIDENFVKHGSTVLSLVPGPYRLRLPN
jgi:hypothetical protein